MGFKTDKSNVGGYHHNHRAPIAGMHTPVWSLTWFLHDPVEEVVIVSKNTMGFLWHFPYRGPNNWNACSRIDDYFFNHILHDFAFNFQFPNDLSFLGLL